MISLFVDAFQRCPAGEQVKDGHPHRDAVGHLFVDDGAGAVGGGVLYLHAAVHGAGVHDDDLLFAAIEPLRGQGEKLVVLADRREHVPLLALLLDAEHLDHVQVGEHLVQVVGDIDTVLAELVGHQRGRSDQSHACSQHLEYADVGPRHPGVEYIAYDAYVKALQRTALFHDGVGVQQRLRRVRVEAVAGVDDGGVDVLR